MWANKLFVAYKHIVTNCVSNHPLSKFKLKNVELELLKTNMTYLDKIG